jgi:ATP-binding cassette subfamily B protein
MKKETEDQKISWKGYLRGIKIIWSEISSRYKKETYILIGISLLIAFAGGLTPLISGKFFDAVFRLEAGIPTTATFFSFGNVWFSLIILIAFTALATFGSRWKGLKGDKVSQELFAKYLADSVKTLLRLPMSFHNDNPISEIDQKIVRAANSLTNMFTGVILRLLPEFLGIGVALITLFSVNTTLAWIIIAGVVLYIIILIRTVGEGALLQRISHKAWVQAWRDRGDGLYNIATVKQFTAEEFESKKNYTNYVVNAWGAQKKIFDLWNRISLWQKIIIIVTQLIVFIVSISFVQKGILTAGGLIALNAYVGMMFGPFLELGNMWRTIQNAIIAISDADEILRTKTEDYDTEDAVKRKIQGDVTFNTITFFHDERKKILNNITLEVKAGQKIALVGETGSGKTSLVELIFRFYTPQKGEILIDGVSIEKYDLRNLRSQIGVVPQEPVLFDKSIRDNISYPYTNIPFSKIEEAAEKAELSNFIKEQPDGWDTIVGDRGVKLSGGQKQRVAIARAIIRNPKILILDESTSALDAKTQKSIEKSLEELMEGKTTFIVAHRLSAVRNADVICVLHKGKIVEQGSHDELMEMLKGKYRKLYDLQFHEKEIKEKESEVLED